MNFIYNDGGEKKLLEICSDSNFNESETWKNYNNNWALYYHLSPLRKNLLSWIDTSSKKNIKILELGAGCGAITSSLCQLPNVVKHIAVEGSSERSKIAEIRCSNFAHVEVINSNFEDFKTKEKFDYVFIIGVLEYSGKYIKGENPYQKFIDHASSYLKEDGNLILAIENQLGHKYIAGYNEDHYGKPYVGLSDYQENLGIRTFDKTTLCNMLSKAGLMHQKYYYPFPDYKLPKVIFTDEAFKTAGFKPLDILDFPTSDFSRPNALVNFNEKKFLELIDKSCDISVFMNSFLIFSSKNKLDIPNDFLAVKFNSERAEEYQTTKYFKKNKNNTIEVETIGKKNSKEKYYKNHSNLFSILVDLFLGNSEDFSKFYKIWEKIVDDHCVITTNDNSFHSFCIKNLGKHIYEHESEWIPSRYLDLIPNNILINSINLEAKIIDQEWDLKTKFIPKKLVMDRGVFYIIHNINKYKKIEYLFNDHWNIPAKLSCDEVSFKNFELFEQWFQNKVRFNKKSLVSDKKSLEKKVTYTLKHRIALKLAKAASKSENLRKIAGYMYK